MGIHSELYVRPTLGFFALSQHVMHDVENDKGDNLIKKMVGTKNCNIYVTESNAQ